MAEFLRTSGISHNIEEIIINAKEKLIIVSPYLKLTDNLFERLKEKASETIDIVFIYGKSELNEYEKQKLYSIPNLNLFYYYNLHAKCYYNESNMLITSMNLHEYSERNNREMGILINKVTDSKIFENAEQESMSILKASVLEKKAFKHENKNQNFITDFEFKSKGDINIWREKLLTLLAERYNSSDFKLGQYKPTIDCDSFTSENLSLIIEPESSFMRIVFKFNGKNRKDLFYTVRANRRNELESSYLDGVVGWGNQMMRIKLDFSKEKYPVLFNYDKNSLHSTMELICNGEKIINDILS